MAKITGVGGVFFRSKGNSAALAAWYRKHLGMPLEDVIAKSTWNPAQQIRRTELGHLSVGAPADLAILSIQRGKFGFTDVDNTRKEGDRKLQGEVTIRDGRIVWDLNGLSMPAWDEQ